MNGEKISIGFRSTPEPGVRKPGLNFLGGFKTDPPNGSMIQIRDLLLPMLFWEKIPIDHQSKKPLTQMQIFVAECAARGSFSTRDIFEITSMDERLAKFICHSLAVAGILEYETSSGLYTPVAPALENLLTEQALPEIKTIQHNLVFLPHTGDLVDISTNRLWETLSRMNPNCQFPLPEELRAEGRERLIQRFFGERRISGIGEDAIEIRSPTSPVSSTPLPKICAAYRFQGWADISSTIPVIHLEPIEQTGRNHSVTLKLEGTAGLAAKIRKCLDSAEREKKAVIGSIFPELVIAAEAIEVRQSAAWTLKVDGRQAKAIASTKVCSGNFQAGKCFDEEMVLGVTISLEPKDQEAAAVLALDDIVDRLIKVGIAGDWAGVIGEIAKVRGLKKTSIPRKGDIITRMWERGFYAEVYRLRQDKDFDYD